MTAVTRAISYYYNKAVVGLLLLLQFCFDQNKNKLFNPKKLCVIFFWVPTTTCSTLSIPRAAGPRRNGDPTRMKGVKHPEILVLYIKESVSVCVCLSVINFDKLSISNFPRMEGGNIYS